MRVEVLVKGITTRVDGKEIEAKVGDILEVSVPTYEFLSARKSVVLTKKALTKGK